MLDHAIQFILLLLIIFTPIAFGAMDLWAVSLMELGILFIIVLYTVQWGILSRFRSPASKLDSPSTPILRPLTPGLNSTLDSEHRTPNSELSFFHLLLFGLFLCLILFQMVPLPSAIVRAISPKTYELRHFLSLSDPQSLIDSSMFPLSLVPFATQVHFIKWLALIGLFLFLQIWDLPGKEDRRLKHFVLIIFLVGVFESLYGMFEVFSGHSQALNIKLLDSSVAGTFISRNTFAGYLLMVIPLGTGFVLSRGRAGKIRFDGWRNRLTSLDGKTTLLGFGVIVMILGLIFSASRMGIISLLLSFTVCAFLFRDPGEGKRISRVPIVILGLALLWAAWIGLDAVVGRFLTTSEDFGFRWAVWADTYRIVKDFPVFGSGLGTFWQVFPMYRSFNVLSLTEHAENDFLQLASETGLAGMGFLLILFSSFFYKAVAGVRSLSWRDPQRYTGMGGLVGILALMFHSLVEKNFLIPGNTFLFVFILVLVLHVGSRTKKDVS